MRFLVAAALVLVLPGSAPGNVGANQTGLAQLEQTIKDQRNSGPHGYLVRDVRCRSTGKDRARCVLTSVIGAEIDARVLLDGDEHRLAWEPLEG
jgi:hypothetical protein